MDTIQIKVRWKEEVIDYIRKHDEKCNGITVDMFGTSEYYNRKLDIPYFIVEEFSVIDYRIIEPKDLRNWYLKKKHVERYPLVDTSLDEELFEI